MEQVDLQNKMKQLLGTYRKKMWNTEAVPQKDGHRHFAMRGSFLRPQDARRSCVSFRNIGYNVSEALLRCLTSSCPTLPSTFLFYLLLPPTFYLFNQPTFRFLFHFLKHAQIWRGRGSGEVREERTREGGRDR